MTNRVLGRSRARGFPLAVVAIVMIVGLGVAPLVGAAGRLPGMPSPLSGWTPARTRIMVLDVGTYPAADSIYARSPAVLRDTDGSYKMWYSGYDGARNRMLYATSPDGLRWTKQGVILDVLTPPYYWDSVSGQSVLKIGSTYHMWFSAGYWTGGTFGYWAQIYHATSTDGADWNVTGVALAPGSGWDAGMVNSPEVIRDAQGLFWLFFIGWDGTTNRLGVATSTDGSMFTPYAGNPVVGLGPAGSWDSRVVQDASVVLEGSSWSMWYDGWNGTGNQIGIAHSNDGYNWTKDPSNPILSPDPAQAWDRAGVSYPDFLSGTSPRLYFVGSDGGYLRIGLVNLTVPGGASPATILGLSVPFFAAVLGFVGVAVASFVVLGFAVMKGSRRRSKGG